MHCGWAALKTLIYQEQRYSLILRLMSSMSLLLMFCDYKKHKDKDFTR